MNIITGKISAIQYAGEMYLVDVDVGDGETLAAVAIGAGENEGLLSVGQEVRLCFKATELSLAKDFSGQISLRNRLPSVVREITMGRLLCKVTLDFKGNRIASLITSRSAERIGIQVGDTVVGLIKANEMILLEEYDGI